MMESVFRAKPLMLPLGSETPAPATIDDDDLSPAPEDTSFSSWLDMPLVDALTPTVDKATTWVHKMPGLAWNTVKNITPHLSGASPWLVLAVAVACVMCMSSLASIVNTLLSVGIVVWAVHFAWKRAV